MIHGISDIRRIPRIGKIRLGIKKKNANGKEYPSEVDYFILDPETPDPKRREGLISQFKELYGEKPKSVKIMFPPVSPELFFAQFYKRYGSGALLKCRGNGEVAETMPDFAEGLEIIGETDRGFVQVKCAGPDCPYQEGPRKQCARMASLQVILPELHGIGVFQINTGSFNSIVNINSAIEWIKGLCGRYAMIPLTLMRVPQDIQYEGKRSKHYVLAIDQQISIGEIQKFAMITPVERALISAPDEKKDELFYDANGDRPQLPGPETVPEVKSPEIVPPTPSRSPKMPIVAPKGELSELARVSANIKAKEIVQEVLDPERSCSICKGFDSHARHCPNKPSEEKKAKHEQIDLDAPFEDPKATEDELRTVYTLAVEGGKTTDWVKDLCFRNFSKYPADITQSEVSKLDALIIEGLEDKPVAKKKTSNGVYRCKKCDRTIAKGQSYCREHRP